MRIDPLPNLALHVVVTLQNGKILTGPDEILEGMNLGQACGLDSDAERIAETKRTEQSRTNRELRQEWRKRAEEALHAMVFDDDPSDEIPSASAPFQYAYTFAVMTIAEYCAQTGADLRAYCSAVDPKAT